VGRVTRVAFSASYVWLMKKRELKNRLRQRTADKLYDLARSTGRVPNQLPAGESPAKTHEQLRRSAQTRGKRQPDQNLAG